MNENISIRKYILVFSVSYSIASAVVAALTTFFKTDGGGSANFVLLMVAAMMAGGQFVQDHKRTPDKSEKIKLIGYSFLAVWLISLVVTGVMILIFPEILPALKYKLGSLSVGLLIGVLIVAVLIMLLMLWLGYGFLTNRQYKTLEKKGKL